MGIVMMNAPKKLLNSKEICEVFGISKKNWLKCHRINGDTLPKQTETQWYFDTVDNFFKTNTRQWWEAPEEIPGKSSAGKRLESQLE